MKSIFWRNMIFYTTFLLLFFRIPTTFQRPPVEEETSKKPIQRPKGGFGIAIKLGGLSSSTSTASKDVKKHPPKKSVASVFNNDSSSGNSWWVYSVVCRSSIFSRSQSILIYFDPIFWCGSRSDLRSHILKVFRIVWSRSFNREICQIFLNILKCS